MSAKDYDEYQSFKLSRTLGSQKSVWVKAITKILATSWTWLEFNRFQVSLRKLNEFICENISEKKTTIEAKEGK